MFCLFDWQTRFLLSQYYSITLLIDIWVYRLDCALIAQGTKLLHFTNKVQTIFSIEVTTFCKFKSCRRTCDTLAPNMQSLDGKFDESQSAFHDDYHHIPLINHSLLCRGRPSIECVPRCWLALPLTGDKPAIVWKAFHIRGKWECLC